MFLNNIKMYFYAFIGFLVAGVGVYIQYLRKSNKNKATEIDTLNNNISKEKEVSKDKIKQAEFSSKQKEKAKQATDDSKTEKLDKERGKVNEKDTINSDFDTITV